MRRWGLESRGRIGGLFQSDFFVAEASLYYSGADDSPRVNSVWPNNCPIFCTVLYGEKMASPHNLLSTSGRLTFGGLLHKIHKEINLLLAGKLTLKPSGPGLLVHFLTHCMYTELCTWKDKGTKKKKPAVLLEHCVKNNCAFRLWQRTTRGTHCANCNI